MLVSLLTTCSTPETLATDQGSVSFVSLRSQNDLEKGKGQEMGQFLFIFLPKQNLPDAWLE